MRMNEKKIENVFNKNFFFLLARHCVEKHTQLKPKTYTQQSNKPNEMSDQKLFREPHHQTICQNKFLKK